MGKQFWSALDGLDEFTDLADLIVLLFNNSIFTIQSTEKSQYNIRLSH